MFPDEVNPWADDIHLLADLKENFWIGLKQLLATLYKSVCERRPTRLPTKPKTHRQHQRTPKKNIGEVSRWCRDVEYYIVIVNPPAVHSPPDAIAKFLPSIFVILAIRFTATFQIDFLLDAEAKVAVTIFDP